MEPSCPAFRGDNLRHPSGPPALAGKYGPLALSICLHLALIMSLSEYRGAQPDVLHTVKTQEAIPVDLVRSPRLTSALHTPNPPPLPSNTAIETKVLKSAPFQNAAPKSLVNPRPQLGANTRKVMKEKSPKPGMDAIADSGGAGELGRSRSGNTGITHQKLYDEVLVKLGTTIACRDATDISCDRDLFYSLAGHDIQGSRQIWQSSRSIDGRPSPYDNLGSKEILEKLRDAIPLKSVRK